ncbi:hypothetical protein NOC27_1657 [Nitrosococcus oceani AFC27]|uniref:Uncharacterized protein n=1 Tax=Nitrosococcus oceani C-27 TaxID=314279 RepID=A0A0E2ZLM8_9GAMM|nr:hypothetical protein NOC27_1657 [Nitrosococcus oceani AFC27]KFI19222.1 hypothetical protein IB75_09700 [Nitrosococcus oceani C-27]
MKKYGISVKKWGKLIWRHHIVGMIFQTRGKIVRGAFAGPQGLLGPQQEITCSGKRLAGYQTAILYHLSRNISFTKY